MALSWLKVLTSDVNGKHCPAHPLGLSRGLNRDCENFANGVGVEIVKNTCLPDIDGAKFQTLQ